MGALLAVAAVAAANVFHTARRVPPPAIAVPAAAFDPLSWHERRFSRFRERVPAHGVRGTIGYFGDLAHADDDYYYAQFALVPLVLDRDPDPYAWALANLPAGSPPARLPAGWDVAEDFGEGVLLLRKTAR
jgi:hypothetical protein